MKKIIVATSGYYGRAILRKYASNKDFRIIGIVDNNKKISGTSFWGHKVFLPDEILKFDFDYIFIGGRDYETISQSLINDLNIPAKKIIRLSKSHLQMSAIDISQREIDTQHILRVVVEQLRKNNIDYWLDFSGLLAFARNQKMAEFSDVELSILDKDLKQVYLILRKLLPNHIIENLYSKNDSLLFEANSMIGIGIYPYLSSSHQSESIEPANITLVSKKIENPYCYWLDIFGNIKQYPSKFFLTSNQVEYESIKLNVPYNFESYLEELYGCDWKVPADYWTGTN